MKTVSLGSGEQFPKQKTENLPFRNALVFYCNIQ